MYIYSQSYNITGYKLTLFSIYYTLSSLCKTTCFGAISFQSSGSTMVSNTWANYCINKLGNVFLKMMPDRIIHTCQYFIEFHMASNPVILFISNNLILPSTWLFNKGAYLCVIE